MPDSARDNAMVFRAIRKWRITLWLLRYICPLVMLWLMYAQHQMSEWGQPDDARIRGFYLLLPFHLLIAAGTAFGWIAWRLTPAAIEVDDTAITQTGRFGRQTRLAWTDVARARELQFPIGRLILDAHDGATKITVDTRCQDYGQLAAFVFDQIPPEARRIENAPGVTIDDDGTLRLAYIKAPFTLALIGIALVCIAVAVLTAMVLRKDGAPESATWVVAAFTIVALVVLEFIRRHISNELRITHDQLIFHSRMSRRTFALADIEDVRIDQRAAGRYRESTLNALILQLSSGRKINLGRPKAGMILTRHAILDRIPAIEPAPIPE